MVNLNVFHNFKSNFFKMVFIDSPFPPPLNGGFSGSSVGKESTCNAGDLD